MEKIVHPNWWKELKSSGRVLMATHLIMEGLGNCKALQCAWWQAAAFRLPLSQHEALGWWDAPPGFSGHHPTDFTGPYCCLWPKGFVGHEAGEDPGPSLGTASPWQRVWVPTGVLCESAQELQKCMTPLMTLSGDNIVEVSLLKPMGDDHRTPPHQRRKLLF